MAQEKIFHLKALGAEVHLTRSDVGKGHPEYYQDMAERMLAETPNAIWINQFANPANPEAHYRTTGPEIWAQMQGELDAVVCGVGSGGTISGLGRFFREKDAGVRMVVADPEGSVIGEAALTGKVPEEVGSWLVEGIGEDFVPPNCDLAMIDDAVTVPDSEGFQAARELVAREGLLGGSSTGTLLAGALAWCREQTEPKRVVTFVCDTGNKYLNKVFNDAWMVDNGLMTLEPTGDLRDLVVRRADRGQVVTCKTTETLATAYGRMRMFDVSQIPILDEDGRMAGLVDESDILLAVHDDDDAFQAPVTRFMVDRLEVVAPDAPMERLTALLKEDKVAIVMQDDRLYGLITKVDFINYMRRRGQ